MPKPLALLAGVMGIVFVSATPQVVEAPAAIILSAPAAAQHGPSATSSASETQAPRIATPPAAPAAKHYIIVKFDFDYGKTPACSPQITQKCIQQFNVYDDSGGYAHRVKLFSFPVPPGSSGRVRGISRKSPRLPFEPGLHVVAVTAQEPDGTESNPFVCTVTIRVKP